MRDDAEALRRRLYAPGASEADVERFLAAEAVLVAGPEPSPPLEEALPAGAPRRRPLVVAVLVLVALLAVLAFAAARGAAGARDAEVPPTPLRMTEADRQDIANAFAGGSSAGIAAFLVTHRAPPALRTATRFFTEEHVGIGTATVDLEPAPAEAFSGRATVMLVLEQPGRVAWSAFRRQVDAAGEQRLVLQRQRGGDLDGEQLTSDTFRYASGDRPVQVRIQAPPGARWGFAVVYSD